MKRREFISLLGGAAAAWPVSVRAQQAGKLPTIGFLGASTAPAMSQWIAAFVQRLHELGWIENRTVAIEYRWGEGRDERYREIAAEFVRLKVDAILSHGTEASLAAKRATSTIPIVATAVGDPVGSGLVTSLARPGGNVTGLSVVSPDTASKRLELLREAVPDLRRLAILLPGDNPVNVEEARQVQEAAATLGLGASLAAARVPRAVTRPPRRQMRPAIPAVRWWLSYAPPVRGSLAIKEKVRYQLPRCRERW